MTRSARTSRRASPRPAARSPGSSSRPRSPAVATTTQVAGRDVIELTDAQGDAPPYAFYAVPVGEDLFLVVASPDLAEDAVGAIPQG